MNYYEAREITKDEQPTGLFHFTKQNDNQIWAVGYCAQDCPGHATKEEAAEHYRQYLLDNAEYDQAKMKDQQRPCLICGEWTQGLATSGPMDSFVLCDAHRNREGLDKVLPLRMQMIMSW